MSDSAKSSSLLSKVMHMVRGAPVASPSALADPDTPSGREALQEAVVRRRRNDAIRQQEFAQLRLLRQRQAQGDSLAQEGGAASELLSSLLGQETRSSETLQKIDAIEAQMSGQWWRQPALSKGNVGLGRRANSHRWSQMPEEAAEALLSEVAGCTDAPHAGLVQAEAVDVPVIAKAPERAAQPVIHAFSPHPDLEEAAILFAHGDIDGSRTRLLEQLVQALNAQPQDNALAAVLWPALLDWCRAVGDEDSFETLSLDYAEHFDRSPPSWFSMPARLGRAPLVGQAAAHSRASSRQWHCPALLTHGAVTAMAQAQQEAQGPWCMSWLRLAAIETGALPALTQLVQTWSKSERHFVWSDAAKLLQLLEQQTPVGERSVDRHWWLLRLAVLQVMDRMALYEEVALDYCITYEVSPPAWESPSCGGVVQEEGDADVTALQESVLHPSRLPLAQNLPLPQALGWGLSGVIEGDAQVWLAALSDSLEAEAVVEVACDNLIRVDFVAAGSILNWAAEMQAKGHTLHFHQVNQLVAVFFHTLGVSAHASIHVTAF